MGMSKTYSNSSKDAAQTRLRPRGMTTGIPSCTWLLETDTQVRSSRCIPLHGSKLRKQLICGRRFIEALDYLLPLVPASLLSARNNAGSTPLHWAALNHHLSIAQRLVQFSGGPGVDLIDIKNASGRSPLGEAENAGWEEGARWFVEVMNLDDAEKGEEELRPAEGVENIEVEIQDAEGQVAKMTIAQQPSR